MKFSEKQIQEYIWEHRDSFRDMILPTDFTEIPNKSPWNYRPWELFYMKIMEQYKKDFYYLEGLNLFGCEVPLDKENENTIRSDFFGCFEGANGFVVCELKVNKAPERQAYTELLAYANQVRSSFGMMGRQDVVYLLITPMQERIVREATINTMLYDRNRIVVLEPIVGEDIESLRLKLWQPSIEDFKIVSQSAFVFENIGTYKVCWDGRGKWSPEEEEEVPDQDMKHLLNQMSAYAAQIMESNGINGFVFCSQSEPDLRKHLPLDCSIIVCGINPFLAAKSKLLFEHGCTIKESAEADVDYFSIFNIFPHLKKKCKEANDENNYWSWMAESWQSCIDEIAFDIKNKLTVSLDCGYLQTGNGEFNWETYLNHSGEDRWCYNYDMHLTGILREIYELYLDKLYEYANKATADERESLLDMGYAEEYKLDMLNSQSHIRKFLRELIGIEPEATISNPKCEDELEIHPNAYEIYDTPSNEDIEQLMNDIEN